MKPRTLIILCVVLAVVFVVGVGAGIGGGKGSAVDLNSLKNASWRASLDKALTRKLDPVHDLVLQTGTPANCSVQPSQIAITAGTGCSYQIGSTFIPLTRRLTLVIPSSAQVSFSLDQPDALPIANMIVTGKTTDLDIYKSGGKLSIVCVVASGGTCLMQVE